MEALTDGIFAISMTLLVLELKIPDLPKSASTSELLEGYVDHKAGLKLHRVREGGLLGVHFTT